MASLRLFCSGCMEYSNGRRRVPVIVENRQVTIGFGGT